MGKIKINETFIFEISIKIYFFFYVYIGIKIQFLEFWLLLSRVAPYYSSLLRTVWHTFRFDHIIYLNMSHAAKWARGPIAPEENSEKYQFTQNKMENFIF